MTRGEYLLYGSRGAGSAAVEAALEIAGARWRLVSAATWDKQSDRAALRAANPLQQIPTLVCPDGSVLTESAAILIHIGLAHPRSGLLPRGAAARAQAIRALVFVAANCYSCIGILDYPQRWLGRAPQAETERLRAGTRRRLHAMWRVFADEFPAPERGFLFGARPGAADLLAAVVSHWGGARRNLQRHRPALHALVERVEAHPSVGAVFARHWGAGPVEVAL